MPDNSSPSTTIYYVLDSENKLRSDKYPIGSIGVGDVPPNWLENNTIPFDTLETEKNKYTLLPSSLHDEYFSFSIPNAVTNYKLSIIQAFERQQGERCTSIDNRYILNRDYDLPFNFNKSHFLTPQDIFTHAILLNERYEPEIVRWQKMIVDGEESIGTLCSLTYSYEIEYNITGKTTAINMDSDGNTNDITAKVVDKKASAANSLGTFRYFGRLSRQETFDIILIRSIPHNDIPDLPTAADAETAGKTLGRLWREFSTDLYQILSIEDLDDDAYSVRAFLPQTELQKAMKNNILLKSLDRKYNENISEANDRSPLQAFPKEKRGFKELNRVLQSGRGNKKYLQKVIRALENQKQNERKTIEASSVFSVVNNYHTEKWNTFRNGFITDLRLQVQDVVDTFIRYGTYQKPDTPANFLLTESCKDQTKKCFNYLKNEITDINYDVTLYISSINMKGVDNNSGNAFSPDDTNGKRLDRNMSINFNIPSLNTQHLSVLVPNEDSSNLRFTYDLTPLERDSGVTDENSFENQLNKSEFYNLTPKVRLQLPCGLIGPEIQSNNRRIYEDWGAVSSYAELTLFLYLTKNGRFDNLTIQDLEYITYDQFNYLRFIKNDNGKLERGARRYDPKFDIRSIEKYFNNMKISNFTYYNAYNVWYKIKDGKDNDITPIKATPAGAK